MARLANEVLVRERSKIRSPDSRTGGSTSAWGGKVSLFDEVDFAARDWIPHSGWPIGQGELAPYTERGAERLGLGPLVNDERFWQAAGRTAPNPSPG